MAEYERHEPEKTLLHEVVREQLEGFLASSRYRDQAPPRFVEQELRAFLRCGVLAHGFLRLHCDDCGHDRLVAFSCKRRGFCPSCGGRRMAETAARLVDRVLPEVPIRQWVLTLPYPLRYRDPAKLDCASEPTARRAVRTMRGSRVPCFARSFEPCSQSYADVREGNGTCDPSSAAP